MVDVKSAAGIQRTTPSFGAKPQQNPSPGSLLGVHTTAQPLPILINRRHSGRTGCQQGGSVMPAYPSHLGSTMPARLSQAYRRGWLSASAQCDASMSLAGKSARV